MLDGLETLGTVDHDTNSRNSSQRTEQKTQSIQESGNLFSKRDLPAVEVRYSSEEYSFSSDAEILGE